MTPTPDTASETVPEYGPKMLALTPKRQAFVVALYDDDAPAKGDGLLIYAARTAGYGNTEGTSNNKSLSVIANRIVQDSGVKEAIAEYSRGIVRAISPEAVRAVRNAIRDPKHKDQIRAAAMVIDRFDPIETTHTVKVQDDRRNSEMAVEKVMERIRELAREAGVVIPPPPKVIEGTCKTIDEPPT
ncbi:MAG TPA: hypothetical protein VHT02_08665 [Methylocella sp.]|nr:hypothetical protein [Methylocella sp.]